MKVAVRIHRPASGVGGFGRRGGGLGLERRRRPCGRWRSRVLAGVLVRAGGRATVGVVRVQGRPRPLAHQILKVRSCPPGPLLPDGGGTGVLLAAGSDAEGGLVVLDWVREKPLVLGPQRRRRSLGAALPLGGAVEAPFAHPLPLSRVKAQIRLGLAGGGAAGIVPLLGGAGWGRWCSR
jgi:hypothetical protein